MKIFITGADGLLGSNLVRELLSRGHQITVLVQANRQTFTLEGLNIKKVIGDILDYKSLEKAAAGIEAIFHVAANTSIWPARDEKVNLVNIEGTKNIIQLAKNMAVNKLIYVGTASSFTFGSKENPGKEGTPYIGAKYGLDYMDSKYLAHQLVLKSALDGVPTVVVSPTFMLGAFDSQPSSGAMVMAVYQEKVPGFAPGGRNYICVKDAAIGIANALEMGRVGESYIIGNENLSYQEAFHLMAEVLQVKAPNISMPKWVIISYAKWGEFWFKLSGKKPTVTIAMAQIACDSHYFSSQKAVSELKLPQTPIKEGIKECHEWLNKNGYF